MSSITPQTFVSKWRFSTLKEKSSYQQHFLDLCHLIGHKEPAEIDPVGDTFCFEAGALKTTGGNGFADVWYRDHFAFEYKGKHADLDKAYQQLLQYREALQNPPLLVVSDLDTIQIHTNFTGTVKRVYTLTLDDLLTTQGLDLLRTVFFNPYTLQAPQTATQVTEEAAAHFARLAEILRQTGNDPQPAAHFLIRLLFCLFAEDTGLLPERLFTRLAVNFRNHPAAFCKQLNTLFEAMSTGGGFGTEAILHFDGHLFDDAQALELSKEGIEILIGVSRLDWANIEPSIFGTLFERSLDPAKRSQLGAHYTSKEDILLIVEPVLMAPLRRKWNEVKEQAQSLAVERDAESGRKKINLQEKLTSLLMAFAEEIAAMQVLDPACGSGNFLYIALRQLLDLQKEVIREAGTLGVGQFFPTVTTNQLHGIEINETAHQLAQATIQIGYIQWLRDNGFGIPPEPILKPLDNIAHKDAILAYDDKGWPIEPEWSKADVIIGNPPFLGDKKMRADLGDKYVEDLRKLYEERIPGGSDLVTYWFECASRLLATKAVKRVGFISTNSIRTGSNRKVLDNIKEIGDIFMAWDDRPWILNGAAVRVSIVGFDDGKERECFLNGNAVSTINADLTSQVDVTHAKSLPENINICFLGVMKGGPFDIEGDQARKLLLEPINPNGKPNSDVVKHRLGGQDVTGRPRDGWIIDFIEMPIEEASLYESPFAYVYKVVKPKRDENRDSRMRLKWWLHGRSRPDLRKAIAGKKRCIVTPEVSKHRIFVWMDTNTIPDHKLHVFAREDDYFLGILQSHIHEVWTLAQCSWMGVGNDPSYSSTRTFETFPFPWPPGFEPQDDPRVQAIASAAQSLVELRDRWLNAEGLTEAERKKRTLTNLYNLRPTWLDLAHKRLDNAVFAAYGWPVDLADEQILERLLELNLERASKT